MITARPSPARARPAARPQRDLARESRHRSRRQDGHRPQLSGTTARSRRQGLARRALVHRLTIAKVANPACYLRRNLQTRRQIRQRSANGLYLDRDRVVGIATDIKQPPEQCRRHLARRKISAHQLGDHLLSRLLDPPRWTALRVSRFARNPRHFSGVACSSCYNNPNLPVREAFGGFLTSD